MNGIPSNGTMVIVGTGQFGRQPTNAVSDLPPSVQNASATGNGSTQSNSGSSSNMGTIVGAVVGTIVAIGVIGGLFGIVASQRQRAASRQHPSAIYVMRAGFGMSGAAALNRHADDVRNSNSSAFVPLQQDNQSMASNASTTSLHSAYRDDYDGRPHYDPYNAEAIGRNSSGQRL